MCDGNSWTFLEAICFWRHFLLPNESGAWKWPSGHVCLQRHCHSGQDTRERPLDKAKLTFNSKKIHAVFMDWRVLNHHHYYVVPSNSKFFRLQSLARPGPSCELQLLVATRSAGVKWPSCGLWSWITSKATFWSLETARKKKTAERVGDVWNKHWNCLKKNKKTAVIIDEHLLFDRLLWGIVHARTFDRKMGSTLRSRLVGVHPDNDGTNLKAWWLSMIYLAVWWCWNPLWWKDLKAPKHPGAAQRCSIAGTPQTRIFLKRMKFRDPQKFRMRDNEYV